MATKRGRLEAKPEQAEGFRNSYESSSRQAPKWRVGNDERAPLERLDTSAPIDLTGRWIHDDAACEYHLFINQAGPHLEGLFATVENGAWGHRGDSRRIARRLVSFAGDYDPNTDMFTVYVHGVDATIDDTSLACGSLGASEAGQVIVLDLDPKAIAGRYDSHKHERLVRVANTRARRLDSGPVALERHLAQPWLEPTLRTGYWFPLTEVQQRELRDYILEARVRVASNFLLVDAGGERKRYAELLRDYHEVRSGNYEGKWLPTAQRAQWQRNIGHALDKLVWQAYQDGLNRPATKGGIDRFAAPLWSQASRISLSQHKLRPSPDGTPQPLIKLTQQLLDDMPGESFKNFADKLELVPQQGGHYYGALIELVDIGSDPKRGKKKVRKILERIAKKKAKKILKVLTRKVPLGALFGLLEIRKQVDPAVPGGEAIKPEWTSYYAIALGGLEVAPGVGTVSVSKSAGEAKHVYGRAWEPKQLEGAVYFQDLSVGAYIGPWGKSLAGTILSCRGKGENKPSAPLHLNFSGFGDVMGGKGASIGVRFMPGWMLHLSDDMRLESIDTGPSEVDFEYGVHSETGPIHFPINGAMLEFVGCKLLEMFAASELAALSTKGCELRLDGYADQPDTEVKNLILSRNRAITCYNYIKNILGPRGKNLPELKDVPAEADEIADIAESEGETDVPQIRDASVKSIEIVAHGEPPMAPGQQGDKHDSHYRRTDIVLNGQLTLSLRRIQDN